MDSCSYCSHGTTKARESLEHAQWHALDGLPGVASQTTTELAETLVYLLRTRKQVEALDNLLTALAADIRMKQERLSRYTGNK